jgi:hypothetical protein
MGQAMSEPANAARHPAIDSRIRYTDPQHLSRPDFPGKIDLKRFDHLAKIFSAD